MKPRWVRQIVLEWISKIDDRETLVQWFTAITNKLGDGNIGFMVVPDMGGNRTSTVRVLDEGTGSAMTYDVMKTETHVEYAVNQRIQHTIVLTLRAHSNPGVLVGVDPGRSICD